MGPGETLIALIIGVTVMGYMFFNGRHKERMAIIQSGGNMSIFDSKKRSGFGRAFTLKLGMLFVGVALGILMGEFLRTNTNMADGAGYMSMILLFGGLSLILNYMIEKRGDN